MSNSLNPVFGEWYTDRQLGSGTDGKVFSIYKEKYDGTREKSVLKIIRLGENRGDIKTIDPNENIVIENEEEYYSAIITGISDNIKSVMESDKGRHFVRYEDFELRKASDGKGRLILLRLEEMRSLADLLKEFSFTLEETLRLGINVCKSLIKCRSFGGYIYPNLKPENILFDRNGVCKLGDFGTFSLLEPAKTSVAYKRTQYYMAPEIIRTGRMNNTADTYALGLVLYMLSNRGRLPFAEPYPEKVTINSLNEGVQKRTAGEKLPEPALASEELRKIIAKACAFKPNERYFTPEQMLSDLTNALNDKPFEEAKYNDVYSVTENADELSEEDILIPDVEDFEREPEKENEVISLKQEIKIPEIVPIYRNEAEPKKKKPVKYEKLPEIKRKKRRNKEMESRILTMIIITVLLFILMVTSIVLHSSGDEDTLQSIAAVVNNYYFMLGGGGLINGC